MKTIRDQNFVRTLTRRFAGCPLDRRAIAELHIEVSGTTGRSLHGLRITICRGSQSIITLGWSRNSAWSVASLARFEDLQHCDPEALSRCVRAFLRKHDLVERDGHSTIECDQVLEPLLRMIGALGEALHAGRWTEARQIWAFLAPLHAGLIERDPLLAHVDTTLRQKEALDSPQMGGIH